jgi:hypothetical protein
LYNSVFFGGEKLGFSRDILDQPNLCIGPSKAKFWAIAIEEHETEKKASRAR